MIRLYLAGMASLSGLAYYLRHTREYCAFLECSNTHSNESQVFCPWNDFIDGGRM